MSDFCVQLLSSFLTTGEQTSMYPFDKPISPLTYFQRCLSQSSVSGPLLFSIYTYDLPLCVFHRYVCRSDLYICVSCVSACYSHALTTLQLSADEVLNWATNNFMTTHPQKVKYIIITTWQKHQRISLSSALINIH